MYQVIMRQLARELYFTAPCSAPQVRRWCPSLELAHTCSMHVHARSTRVHCASVDLVHLKIQEVCCEVALFCFDRLLCLFRGLPCMKASWLSRAMAAWTLSSVVLALPIILALIPSGCGVESSEVGINLSPIPVLQCGWRNYCIHLSCWRRRLTARFIYCYFPLLQKATVAFNDPPTSTLLVSTLDGTLYSLTSESGEVRWKHIDGTYSFFMIFFIS